MASGSLRHWQSDRMPRLTEIETHCAAAAALVPPNPLLAEESLRASVMLLSGHFQGFCRDLYTECVQVFTSNVPPALQAAVQVQFLAELRIDSSNPTVETLRKDFERFDLKLGLGADPANGPRITHLGYLNKWRNAIAHQKTNVPPGVPPLTLVAARDWRVSCDELATWLDAFMYNRLQATFGVAPW